VTIGESERRVLEEILDAARDRSGVKELYVAQSSIDGADCVVLCVVEKDPIAETISINPVALLISPEEANKMTSPYTGRPGLPWLPDPRQQTLDLPEDDKEKCSE